MGILLKIVYRNLKQHRVKTLIIGIIVALGMFILIAGNSIIDTITAGISRNFVEYNTGHIVVFPSSIEQPSLAGGGPEAMMNDDVVPTIDGFTEVLRVIEANRDVVGTSPQIDGTASIQYGDEGSGFTRLLGVDPERYRAFFPDNIDMIEGRFLEPGEEGIVLPTGAVEMLEEASAAAVRVGDRVLLTSSSRVSGMKVREVPIVGIYEVQVATQFLLSYLDGENMRVLGGLTKITDIDASLTTEEQGLLGSVSEESLFGDDDSVVIDTARSTSRDAEELLSVFRDTTNRERYGAVDPDAWHYLLVRLENGARIANVVRELNAAFTEQGLTVTAYSWIEAAGQVAEMTTALRLIFNVIILIIAVVAVIIIMNTLVISVTERIGEIGTMRAIGAKRSFVRRMIVLETAIIMLVFGGIGIAAGLAAIAGVRIADIETQNLILQMLAGGSRIRPILTLGSVGFSFAGMLVAGVLASLYPAALALRIEPRQAMASK